MRQNNPGNAYGCRKGKYSGDCGHCRAYVFGTLPGRRLNLTSDTFEAVGKYKKGLIKKEELDALEMCACPGAGSCQGMYTANTMACVTEALGMSIEGCATALAVSSKREG